MSQQERNFRTRWVASPDESNDTPGQKTYYHREAPDAWRAYSRRGNQSGLSSDMDVLVFLSNGAMFINKPRFKK